MKEAGYACLRFLNTLVHFYFAGVTVLNQNFDNKTM